MKYNRGDRKEESLNQALFKILTKRKQNDEMMMLYLNRQSSEGILPLPPVLVQWAHKKSVTSLVGCNSAMQISTPPRWSGCSHCWVLHLSVEALALPSPPGHQPVDYMHYFCHGRMLETRLFSLWKPPCVVPRHVMLLSSWVSCQCCVIDHHQVGNFYYL